MDPRHSIEQHTAIFEERLKSLSARRYSGDRPLAQAMRYALDGHGKRVRPTLTLLTAVAVGGEYESAMGAALAVEFLHTYSLVHDDLPCMDDDSMRRGRPTVHKAFDEATALLVGDALLTDAFFLLTAPLAEAPAVLSASQRLAIINELSGAAGGLGMVAGQMLDLSWTRRGGATKLDLDEIHNLKTGYLLSAAIACGAIAGGLAMEDLIRLQEAGAQVGLAFQIRDDLIDGLASTGKSSGKDAAQGKLTYLSLIGPEAAQAEVDRLSQAAIHTIESLGPAAAPLANLIATLVGRTC